MKPLKHLKSAPFTWLMACTLLGLFAAPWLAGGEAEVSALRGRASQVTDSVLAGEWWRLLSSDLVHRDWDHILGNASALIVLGLLLEPKLGTGRMALLYFLGAIGSSLGTLAFYTNGAGASGAIYALMGAYLSRPLRQWEDGQVTIGFGWLVAAWWVRDAFDIGSEYGNVGHAAHVGGFIVGLCVGAFYDDRHGPILGWSRPRRCAAAVLVSLGLVAALALDHRWSMGWNRNVANRVESTEGWLAAQPYWNRIEEVAGGGRQVDAFFLERTARFRLRGHDFVGARRLLRSVASKLDEAEVYQATAYLLVQYEPRDERTALRYWRRASLLSPDDPDILDSIAWAIVSSEDSLGRPEEARALANRAVALDRMRTPEFFRTLAWAHHECGDTDRAIVWMRRAIQKGSAYGELFATELEELEQERNSTVPPGTVE